MGDYPPGFQTGGSITPIPPGSDAYAEEYIILVLAVPGLCEILFWRAAAAFLTAPPGFAGFAKSFVGLFETENMLLKRSAI